MSDIKKPSVSGERVQKSIGRKFVDLFIAEDVKSVKEYIIKDVFVPTVKNGVVRFFDILLNGKSGAGKYTNYTSSINSNITRLSYWKSPDTQSTRDAYGLQQAIDYDFIEVGSAAEATELLDYLSDIMKQFNKVTITDLYEAITPADKAVVYDPSYNIYGWRSLIGFNAVPRLNGRYLIKTPRPIYLK